MTLSAARGVDFRISTVRRLHLPRGRTAPQKKAMPTRRIRKPSPTHRDEVAKTVHGPTLRSTVDSGMLNSPIMQRGMAPPHGLALSIFLSNRTVSMLFSWAKISAAHAPEGPPPTTATLYFMSKEEEAEAVQWETPLLRKEDGVNDATVPTRRGAMTCFMLEIEGGEIGGEEKWMMCENRDEKSEPMVDVPRGSM